MTKILIVEDDPVMVRMYRQAFEHEGMEVTVANDGLEGLAAAKSFKPDMIVLDIMMPTMSGMQVLDALKAEPETERIPVLVFTNLSGRQDLDEVLAKGAIAAVEKAEKTPKQIVEMVRDEVARRS
jgi:putative two-component system response regulator